MTKANVATNDTSQERVDEIEKQRHDTPPQRTWVGLTDEEIEAAIPYKNLSGEYYYDDVLNIVLLIQAKLKRKNI
jgi:hypothetical protein